VNAPSGKVVFELGAGPQTVVAGEVVEVARLVVVHGQAGADRFQPPRGHGPAPAGIDHHLSLDTFAAVHGQAGHPRYAVSRDGSEAGDALPGTDVDRWLVP
jgi:hypothetical protein